MNSLMGDQGSGDGRILEFLRRVLDDGETHESPVDYLHVVVGRLLGMTTAEEAELRVREGARFYRARAWRRPAGSRQVRVLPCFRRDETDLPCLNDGTVLEQLCADIANGSAPDGLPGLAHTGTYVADDLRVAAPFDQPHPAYATAQGLGVTAADRSLMVVALRVRGEVVGLLRFKSRRRSAFGADEVRLAEEVAPVLAALMMRHRAERYHRERVKELRCLYGLTRLLADPSEPWAVRMQSAARLLPPAWQYPEITSAVIRVDGADYAEGPNEGVDRQRSAIVVAGVERGFVEVAYRAARTPFDEGPFLREERDLLDAVAHQIAAALEYRETRRARDELESQLQHADRLATVGVMAAEIAHEINEPLGAVLGFAQLARKAEGLPEHAASDLDRITSASLHAREIIRKLLTFTRRMVPTRGPADLNEIVRSALELLEPRLRRLNVAVDFAPVDGLSRIPADRAQMIQVAVNLIVNGAQAMPGGGRLAVETRREGGDAVFSVRDQGAGMEDAVRDRVFEPFFTTRTGDEGTGLGLSVVRGIVLAHGGSVSVDSAPGRGSTFTVRLPMTVDGGAR